MAVAVPLQIKALPARLEERVETHIVVLAGALDLAGTQQVLAFPTNLFPVLLERAQVWKVAGGQVRSARQFGEEVEKAVHRRQEGRVIAELAAQLVSHPATQVDVGNGDNVESNNDEFQGIRHKSEENRLPLRAHDGRGLKMQHLKSQFTKQATRRAG